MTSIGEQIREARKAKGLTQDALAEAMSVTRAAVANWEQNRRQPDAGTLLRQSKVLEYSFESESALGPTPSAERRSEAAERPRADMDEAEAVKLSQIAGGNAEAAERTEAVEERPERSTAAATPGTEAALEWIERGREAAEISSQAAASMKKSARRMRALVIGGAAVALVILLGWLVLPRWLQRDAVSPYESPEGERYPLAFFQQPTENVEGKPYLVITPELTISKGDNVDYWMYEIRFSEMNGFDFTIDRVEQVYFSRSNKNMNLLLGPKDFQAGGLSTQIDAYGEWSYTGGLPVQDAFFGLGVLMRGHDASGEALAFAGYLPLAAE